MPQSIGYGAVYTCASVNTLDKWSENYILKQQEIVNIA